MYAVPLWLRGSLTITTGILLSLAAGCVHRSAPDDQSTGIPAENTTPKQESVSVDSLIDAKALAFLRDGANPYSSRIGAIEALSAKRDKRAVATLNEFISTYKHSDALTNQAVIAAGEIGERSSIDAINKLLYEFDGVHHGKILANASWAIDQCSK